MTPVGWLILLLFALAPVISTGSVTPESVGARRVAMVAGVGRGPDDRLDSREIVQIYEVRDPRYCWITPRPLLCRDCLRSGLRLARRIRFEPDGRPVRTYFCRR